MVIIRLHRGFQDTRNTLLPLFYVATCTTLFRDAAYLGAFIFNTSANSCWLGRLVIPQDTTCRPISRTKVLAITSTSIEGLLPPPREQIHTHTHTHTYLYIYRVYFSDVERRNGGRTHSIPNAFIHTLFFNPPLPPSLDLDRARLAVNAATEITSEL